MVGWAIGAAHPACPTVTPRHGRRGRMLFMKRAARVTVVQGNSTQTSRSCSLPLAGKNSP
jgi:hypothetical protein